MARMLEKLAQAFLVISLLSWLGWLITRFTGPIGKISYEGFLMLTLTSVGFVIAISLCRLTLTGKSGD